MTSNVATLGTGTGVDSIPLTCTAAIHIPVTGTGAIQAPDSLTPVTSMMAAHNPSGQMLQPVRLQQMNQKTRLCW